MAEKEIIYELCFQVTKTEYSEITEKVEKRIWKLLTDPVTRVNATLVREFYANAVRLGYPGTIFCLCAKSGVVFEDGNPVWIKVGIPITLRRMHAVAPPLPQRILRKRPAYQVEEGQNLEEQAPTILDMHKLQEAIDGLSRQYIENQGAQKELQLQMMDRQEESFSRWMNQQGEWQKQLMEQQLEQGRQWGESFHRLNQKQDQQQEAIQKLINIQAHQGAHIHEMHRKQRE
ncbi:uncharacterized protein LOC107469734 [Arachis duranensis]|uniref:Uncharacterized protein LOC107469734 n=1 Tax=Arachis duranensis TaxID=130453 RepID=A0A6P4BRH0_ARADU|nr:uncharacterized protein LOC107469734 [Arachis duranensis]